MIIWPFPPFFSSSDCWLSFTPSVTSVCGGGWRKGGPGTSAVQYYAWIILHFHVHVIISSSSLLSMTILLQLIIEVWIKYTPIYLPQRFGIIAQGKRANKIFNKNIIILKKKIITWQKMPARCFCTCVS